MKEKYSHKEKNVGIILSSTFFFVIIGLLIGFSWALGLGNGLWSGSKIGAGLGGVLGILYSFIQIGALSRRNLTHEEVSYFNGSILAMIGIFGVLSGIVVWIGRLIFF